MQISQNEPNFCSRLEVLTVSLWDFRYSQWRGVTRTVADPVYAFGSRQSRSAKNQPQRLYAKRSQSSLRRVKRRTCRLAGLNALQLSVVSVIPTACVG